MSLTIIAYHYVRPLPDPRFPSLRGRDIADFRTQLRYLTEAYRILQATELMDAIQSGVGLEGLPPNSALLTFDDGYLDHYAYVAPLLEERRVPGCFFPMARSVRERKLSDANKIQLLLKEEPEALWREAKALWRQHRELPDTGPTVARRFDTPCVAAIKQLLQQGKPDSLRQLVLDSLFGAKITEDEASLAEALYMTEGQVRELAASGMYVGSHGYSHGWLGNMTLAEAKADLEASLGFLRHLDVDTSRWILCYPNGSYNDDLKRLLPQMGAVAALTVEPGTVQTLRYPFALSRWDTNDLPSA